MSPASAAAFGAGVLLIAAAADLSGAVGSALASRAPRMARAVGALSLVVVRVGREGRDPGASERRRLLLAGAALALAGGTLLVGWRAGLLLSAVGPLAVSRLLRARRERYRRAVARDAPALALALADALGGGHSLRGAVVEAARGLDGPAGRELRRVAAELDLGARTEEALEAMRARIRDPGIDTIVAAAVLQRRAGGDLATLLRDSARAFEDQARVEAEARSATAQARFTGLIVVLMPLGGVLIAELASPGYTRGLAGSFLTAWLGGIAVVLQIVAAIAIRRLGRVRT
ncbi:MAG: type II secretion system F family protein [Thermoleophilaceae bacterium]